MLPIDSIMFARASVSTNLICKLIIKTPTQKKTILISATNDLAPILNVLQKHFFSVSLLQERFTLHGIILISATNNHAPILNIFQKHFFSFDFLAERFTLHGISKISKISKSSPCTEYPKAGPQTQFLADGASDQLTTRTRLPRQEPEDYPL